MSDQSPPILEAAPEAAGSGQDPAQETPPLTPLPSVPQPTPEAAPANDSLDIADASAVTENKAVEVAEPLSEPTAENRANGPDWLTALGQTQEVVERHLERLQDAFDTKLAVDQVKDKQIDTLHRQVQEHKRDLLAKAMRPLISGLVRLHDNLGRSAESVTEAEQSLSAEELSQLLGEFQEDVEMLLEDNGVVLFSEPVERLEPRRQTVRKTLPCPDSSNVGDIARRVRPGFERDGQILQKERVDVYVAADPSHLDPATL